VARAAIAERGGILPVQDDPREISRAGRLAELANLPHDGARPEGFDFLELGDKAGRGGGRARGAETGDFTAVHRFERLGDDAAALHLAPLGFRETQIPGQACGLPRLGDDVCR
jgi:hypothetical protein